MFTLSRLKCEIEIMLFETSNKQLLNFMQENKMNDAGKSNFENRKNKIHFPNRNRTNGNNFEFGTTEVSIRVYNAI